MMSSRPTTHTRPHLDRPLSSPTFGQFSASTFASLGYSDSFVRGMFRDQSSASSSPPPSPQRRPQRPRRPSSGLVPTSATSPSKPSMPHSLSYSIPPLGERMGALEIEERIVQSQSLTAREGKQSVGREDIRVVRREDEDRIRLAPPPKLSSSHPRQRSYRRSLPLQPAPPPPTMSLPPVPTGPPASSRSASPSAEALRERRLRSRSPVVEAEDERRREREGALRALEGRR